MRIIHARAHNESTSPCRVSDQVRDLPQRSETQNEAQTNADTAKNSYRPFKQSPETCDHSCNDQHKTGNREARAYMVAFVQHVHQGNCIPLGINIRVAVTDGCSDAWRHRPEGE